MDLGFLKSARDSWYPIPADSLPEKQRDVFSKRKKAVDMYIDGYLNTEITRTTGIDRSFLVKLIKRCIKTDENGIYFGYYALIPGSKIEKKGFAREFSSLLKQYPELKDYILGNYLGDRKYTLEKNMNFITLHKKFLQKCKQLGVQDYEYPLNTQTQGYNSLINFVKKYLEKNIEDAAIRESKDSMQKLLSTGKGRRYTANSVIPFHSVQGDGHRLDMGYRVEVDNGDGTVSKVMAERPWYIPIFEVSTRCLIDFYVSQGTNYDQFDLLKAVQNAILTHKKIPFTIQGLKYPDNGGYPSLAIPEYENALFDEIMLDNAKSHLAGNTIEKLVNTIGCVVNYGSVATPETRGIVERFFGSIESRGFHRLPGTTGSNPRDTKRRKPEKEVVYYDITFEQICELLEILGAEYNNTPHPALNNETPLEALRRKLGNPFLRPTIADDAILKKVQALTLIEKKVKVHGNIKNGKRPYIQYMNAIYRNDVLSSNSSYIGKTITIVIDPDDVSYVTGFSDTGFPIGTLYAAGGYGKTQHSLKARKAAAKLSRENGRNKNVFADPIYDYEQHLREQAKKSRNAATKADRLRRESSASKHSEEKRTNAEILSLPDAESKVDTVALKTVYIDGKPTKRPMTMEEYLTANNIVVNK